MSPPSLDTVTLALEGEVDLGDFADAMVHFSGLLRALTEEVASTSGARWIVEHLASGSALASARALTETPAARQDVERVVQGYLNVGRALEQARPLPYSFRVEKEARALIEVLPRVDSIRFETAEDEAVLAGPIHDVGAQLVALPGPGRRTRSYGAIRGRIQTLSSRGGLQFTLFDALTNRAVRCYLAEGQEDLMRKAWDELAIVAGQITRDENGRPLNVRHVTEITVVEKPGPFDYLRAKGALEPPPDAPLPEVALRRLRDAG